MSFLLFLQLSVTAAKIDRIVVFKAMVFKKNRFLIINKFHEKGKAVSLHELYDL